MRGLAKFKSGSLLSLRLGVLRKASWRRVHLDSEYILLREEGQRIFQSQEEEAGAKAEERRWRQAGVLGTPRSPVDQAEGSR